MTDNSDFQKEGNSLSGRNSVHLLQLAQVLSSMGMFFLSFVAFVLYITMLLFVGLTEFYVRVTEVLYCLEHIAHLILWVINECHIVSTCGMWDFDMAYVDPCILISDHQQEGLLYLL